MRLDTSDVSSPVYMHPDEFLPHLRLDALCRIDLVVVHLDDYSVLGVSRCIQTDDETSNAPRYVLKPDSCKRSTI